MSLCTIYMLLIAHLIGLNLGAERTDISLQICIQQEDGKEDFVPIVHTPVKDIPVLRNNDHNDVQIEPCVNGNSVKISFLISPGLAGEMALCLFQHTGRSPTAAPTCFGLSGLQKVEENTTITCWFKKNITVKTIVEFYISYRLDEHENHQPISHYNSVHLHNKGMCEEPICEQVEPVYSSMFSCGHVGLLFLPRHSSVVLIVATCTSCKDAADEFTVEWVQNKTDSSRVTMQFEETLPAGSYNLTIWLKITDKYDGKRICPYRKSVTIVCTEEGTDSGRTVGVTLKSTQSHCEVNPKQCSFVTFVLFGLAVSSVFILLIFVITIIVIKRTKIARKLRSVCYGDMGHDAVSQQHTLMLPNNQPRPSSPVVMYIPRHPQFQKIDDKFRLIFLPRPYDQFTRDCVLCIRKVLSLDGRIHSACVFDKPITTKTLNNRYAWIERTLNDPYNILIFLFFTSIRTAHEPSIVDEVMRMCQTRPMCRIILAHVTDSTDQLNEVKFFGSSFNIMNMQGYELFLKSVFTIYGYKSNNEFDKQKFKQIMQCGASNQFLTFLNKCPTEVV